MTLEIGYDRVTVAFVALEANIGDLDKATEMPTDKDIASDGNRAILIGDLETKTQTGCKSCASSEQFGLISLLELILR
jgi:hypothetical protein